MRDIAPHSHPVRPVAALVISLFALLFSTGAADTTGTRQSGKSDSTQSSTDAPLFGKLIITYFHGNVRCATCRKMGAYAKEAIDSNLASRLADGTIEWRTVNFDEDGNDHFLKDYQLFGQALILSWVKDGKEVEWKDLDQIWQVVRDKEKYLAYVEQEVNAFLEQRKK